MSLVNAGDERRLVLSSKPLHSSQVARKNLSHLLARKALAGSQHKYAQLGGAYRYSLERSKANPLVLRQDDPTSGPNARKPIYIERVLREMIVVEFDAGAGIA